MQECGDYRKWSNLARGEQNYLRLSTRIHLSSFQMNENSNTKRK